MKIIIADDEELVRVGLCDILNGLVPDSEIHEVENGRLLIESVNSLSPDLCFVDIRMPGISGLEAIAELSSGFPGTSWIILSGYSDFDYARKALNIGVTDYLLKPATESEVSAAVQKAAERRTEYGRRKREKFEYRAGGVINNTSAAEFDDFLMQLDNYAAVVYLQDNLNNPDAVGFQRRLCEDIRNRLDSSPPEGYAGVFNIRYGFPAVIAGGGSPGLLLKELQDLQDGVAGLAGGFFRIIASPVAGSLAELLAFFDSSPELKEAAGAGGNDEASDRSSRIVRRAEELVHELYNEPIGVAQIAEQLNITPNYLSSLFKKYRNKSFTSYITELRLEKAPALLEEPGITVREASLQLGYMSSRHFTRLFREKYGLTPSDYINSRYLL